MSSEAAHVADRIERHLAANEVAPARDLLNRILPELGRDIAIFQDPGQVSFHAGFAYVCIKLDRLDRALHYTGLGLLGDAQDAALHALLTPEQKQSFAQEFIRRGHIVAAMAILQLALATQHSDAMVHMLGMLEYFEAKQARIRASGRQGPGGRRPLLLNVSVWGADYVRDFLYYGLPSLMAEGNIPRCARDRKVILDIYTTAADRKSIETSAAGIAAAQHAALQFNIIPQAVLPEDSAKAFVNSDRWCCGGAQLCSALRAWHIGADLSFITASGIYSNQCFSAASAFVDDGYAVVMACTTRAHEAVRHDALRNFAAISPARIDVDAASLVAFIAQNLHPHYRNLFLCDPPQSARQDPTTLYFKTPSGYASRTFQPAPVLISHDALCGDFRFDYMTTDARFVAELFRGRDPDGAIKIAQNPGDSVVVADLEAGSGAGMKEYDALPVTLEVCAACVLGTAFRESDLGFYTWLLAQRFAVTVEASALPGGAMEEQAAVDRLLELVRQGSAPVIEKIRLYENSTPPEA